MHNDQHNYSAEEQLSYLENKRNFLETEGKTMTLKQTLRIIELKQLIKNQPEA